MRSVCPQTPTEPAPAPSVPDVAPPVLDVAWTELERLSRHCPPGYPAADWQDVCGQAGLSLAEAIHAGAEIRNPRGWIRKVVRACWLNAGDAPKTTLIAWRMLRDRIGAAVGDLGRELTGAEVAALAAEVRESFPSRYRPARDYWYTPRRPVSVEAGSDRREANLLDTALAVAAPQPADDDVCVPGSWTSIAIAITDGLMQRTPCRAGILAWAVHAEATGAPMPLVANVASSTADRHHPRAAGQAARIARDWLDGRRGDDDPGVVALFVPWEGVGTFVVERPGVRERVAADLCAMDAGRAERLWSSAWRMSLRTSRDRLAGMRAEYAEVVARIVAEQGQGRAG